MSALDTTVPRPSTLRVEPSTKTTGIEDKLKPAGFHEKIQPTPVSLMVSSKAPVSRRRTSFAALVDCCAMSGC